MRFVVFFFIFMIICFVTPSLFLRDVLIVDAGEFVKNIDVLDGIKELIGGDKLEIEESKDTNNLDNINIEERENIKLLLTAENKIVEMPFEEYLVGVLIGEVPSTYELEALKAQALVARTYTMHKLKYNPSAHNGADMCDDINCCQCFKTKEYAFSSWDDAEENAKWAKLCDAVNSTAGQYITYSGDIIAAYFHAHSGRATEDSKYVWGNEEIPYLKSVTAKEDYLYEDALTISQLDLTTKLKSKYPNYSGERLEVLGYTGSNRIDTLKAGIHEVKATSLRSILGLRSTNFEIVYNESGDVTFKTIGYGHGVGMSQEGANAMAKAGATCEEIIKYYYQGVEIYNSK